MVRAWGLLLRLYPSKYRTAYCEEMKTVFEQAAEDERKRGLLPYARFLVSETVGLLGGSAEQWFASVAGGNDASEPVPCDAALSDQILAAELRIAANLRRMEYAIAHHQFPEARFFSKVDQRERERLAQLRAQMDSHPE